MKSHKILLLMSFVFCHYAHFYDIFKTFINDINNKILFDRKMIIQASNLENRFA